MRGVVEEEKETKSRTSNHQRNQARKEGVIQERPRLEEAQNARNSVFFDFRISSSLLDLIGASKQASKEGGVDGLVSWPFGCPFFFVRVSYLLKYQVPKYQSTKVPNIFSQIRMDIGEELGNWGTELDWGIGLDWIGVLIRFIT